MRVSMCVAAQAVVIAIGTIVIPGSAEADICSGMSGTAACSLSTIAKYGFSDGPVAFSITAGTDNYSISANNVTSLVNQFNAEFPGPTAANQQLTATFFSDIFGAGGQSNIDFNQALFTNYPKLATLPMSASMHFDGLILTVAWPANSTTVTASVTGTNILHSATGATRYDAAVAMGQWITANQNTLLNELHNAIAAHTDSDPVIGNPQSLMGSLATTTYSFGSDDGEFSPQTPSSSLSPTFAMSVEPQYYEARGISGTAVRVPLDYTWYLSDPRYAVTLDLPITYINQGSTNSLDGALGVGVRVPLSDNWYVTPQFHLGAIGALGGDGAGDYGAALYSLGARSKYNIFLMDDALELSIINAAAFYKSLDIQIGKYSLDPDLESGIFSNGLTAQTDSTRTLFGNPATWQAYFVDNRIVGTHSQISGWDEIGVSYGTRTGMTAQSWENLRFGSSLAFGQAGYRALELNLTVRF